MQPSGWRRRARAPSRPRVPCAGPIPVPPVRGCVCDFFFSFSRFYPALGPFIRAPMPTGTQPRTCSHLPGSAGVGAHFSEILSTGGEYNFVPVGPVIAGPFFFNRTKNYYHITFFKNRSHCLIYMLKKFLYIETSFVHLTTRSRINIWHKF